MVDNGSSSCETFQITLLPSMYGAEFCVALVGNVFALWLLVSRERRNWHTGVVLSCNLAVSDLLYVLTLPLLIAYYLLGKHWIFGAGMCKLERFLFTCNLYASVFFIMGISVNRCVALAHPFFSRNHVHPARVKAACVITWVLVGVISGPVLKFASVCPAVYTNATQCVSHCNQTHGDARAHFTYQIFLSVFGCFVPFLVTFTAYCVVVWVVWKNANITTLEKRKVALMVVSVLMLYVISFVPYHVSQTYYFYRRIKYPNEFDCSVYRVYQVSKGLATLNMCVHPLLYVAVFDSIRIACCGKSPEDRKNREIQCKFYSAK